MLCKFGCTYVYTGNYFNIIVNFGYAIQSEYWVQLLELILLLFICIMRDLYIMWPKDKRFNKYRYCLII